MALSALWSSCSAKIKYLVNNLQIKNTNVIKFYYHYEMLLRTQSLFFVERSVESDFLHGALC